MLAWTISNLLSHTPAGKKKDSRLIDKKALGAAEQYMRQRFDGSNNNLGWIPLETLCGNSMGVVISGLN